LHRAKVEWFSNETMLESLTSMKIISVWYEELNLTFAAKYYSLSAAFIAINSNSPQITALAPEFMLRTARSDYSQGA